mmetsp:Transcript_2460/g.4324  ORF Transcript_2460/g.4324 Transcript_2460/m.4324 type:complete len:371 (-) Transcript_2460:512-1624(-)
MQLHSMCWRLALMSRPPDSAINLHPVSLSCNTARIRFATCALHLSSSSSSPSQIQSSMASLTLFSPSTNPSQLSTHSWSTLHLSLFSFASTTRYNSFTISLTLSTTRAMSLSPSPSSCNSLSTSLNNATSLFTSTATTFQLRTSIVSTLSSPLHTPPTNTLFCCALILSPSQIPFTNISTALNNARICTLTAFLLHALPVPRHSLSTRSISTHIALHPPLNSAYKLLTDSTLGSSHGILVFSSIPHTMPSFAHVFRSVCADACSHCGEYSSVRLSSILPFEHISPRQQLLSVCRNSQTHDALNSSRRFRSVIAFRSTTTTPSAVHQFLGMSAADRCAYQNLSKIYDCAGQLSHPSRVHRGFTRETTLTRA